MIRTNWTARLGGLFTTISPRAKRVPLGRLLCGSETEQLENRALLSACGMKDDVQAPPALASVAARAKANVPQNVAGTWDLTGTGKGQLASVGEQSGTAKFTQTTSTVTMTLQVDGLEASATITLPVKGNKASGQISIPGFGDFPASGTATKNKLSLTGKTEVAGKNVTIKLEVKFATGANPTKFTGTLKVAGKTAFDFSGTKQ